MGMPPISSSSGVVKNTICGRKAVNRIDEHALLEHLVVEVRAVSRRLRRTGPTARRR